VGVDGWQIMWDVRVVALAEARFRLNAAASAFDNGYTLALAITAIALAAGGAFTYGYLKRPPTASTQQAQHPTEGIDTAGIKTA
jgi:hypothetical protein